MVLRWVEMLEFRYSIPAISLWKYAKRANRLKGRDAKQWGLRSKDYGSPVAGVSILPF